MRRLGSGTAVVVLLIAGAAAQARPAADDRPHYVYEQTTGNFYLVAADDRPLLGTGYSGTGDGRNNPEMQGTRNVGPIPQGRWRIGDAHDSRKTGKLVMDLTPVGHDALARSDFQIHGDNARTHDASHGCIVLGRDLREKIAAGEVRELEVVRGPDPARAGGPIWPIGPDTSYVTGPLRPDGTINYEAALNDRLAKGITPETNANVLILKSLGPHPEGAHMPAAYFKRLGIDEPPADGDYFIPLGRFLREQLGLDQSDAEVVYDQEGRAGRRPWTAKDYPHIAEWLKANENALAVAVEATKRPDYYNPLVSRSNGEPGSLISALLPSVQKCRETAAALSGRAMLRTAEGKYDEAWQDLLACHRLGRLVGRGGTLIEALVGIAIDVIASNADLAYLERAGLTADQALDRLKDLQALPPMPPAADKLDLTERFEFLDAAEMVRLHGLNSLEAFLNGSAAPEPDAVPGPTALDWAPILRNGNAWYDRIVAAMRLKDRAEREKELDRIERELKALKAENSPPWNVTRILLGKDPPEVKASKAVGDALVALLIPGVRKVHQAHERDEQVQRNVQVAFALAAYRADHGHYPAGLAALVPRYLPAVPDDLFSGAAPVYRPSVQGYLLYSVGVNGQDEGGRSYDDEPRGDDLPVAMPLPGLKPRR